MAITCAELTHPNFVLKVAELILGGVASFIVFCYGYYVVVTGYYFSYLTIILALSVTSLWFGESVPTELCLLVVALIKLVIATTFYHYYKSPKDWAEVKNPAVNVAGKKAATKYYVFMIVNIISMVFIVIDIILRVTNK